MLTRWVRACGLCPLVSCVPIDPPPVAPPDVVTGVGGQWEVRARVAGGVRQEIGVVCNDDEVIILGGFGADGITARVDAYHPGADAWRALPDLPEPLHHANVGIVNDTIVVAGFLVGSGFDPRGDVYLLSLADDEPTWRVGAAMPALEARGAAGVAVYDGALYVFGGHQNGSVASSSRYRVSEDAWDALPPLPEALDHLGAATVDGHLAVVGGRTNGLFNLTGSLLTFDPIARTFTSHAPMPTPRAGFALAAIGDRLLVVGGEGSGAPGGVFAETEAWSPATDTWETLVPMRTPRHGMGACALGGALYVPGGADVQGFAAVDVNERFVPHE